MMNRGVMQRQMFRNGGEASFPDLSGDGRISQKDVLMGRGVQGLAMGGPPMDPNMMPPPPPMDPNMMPPPPMAPPPMPPAGAEQALMGAEAQGQQAGMMAMEGMMQDIDGAQDYESLINGLRGNDMPLDARYAELAGLVGPEDAQQTPESVLTLTQPAIMMTEEGALNSGVGELMRGIAGDVEMEGPMSEGVGGLMMAQAPEPAMNDPMMEAGNTPPVNFRQGGPVEVRGYQAGDEAKVGGGQPLNPVIAQAKRDASAYQDYFAGAMDSEARAADLEEQRKMSQAQMLFDIAQAGLQFAGTTEGSSIAERLANAAAQTQLPQRIGERSAQMLAAKQGQRAEDRQMRMAGLQASLQQSIADKSAADALALKTAGLRDREVKPKSLFEVTTNDAGQPVLKSIGTFDLNNKDANVSNGFFAYNDAFKPGILDEEGADDFRALIRDESGAERGLNVALADGKDVNGETVNRGDILTGTPRELKRVFGNIPFSKVPSDALSTFTTLFKVTYDENNFAVPETKSVVKLDAVNNIEAYEKKGYSTDRAVYDQAIATNARLDEAAEAIKTIKIVRKAPDGTFETLGFNTFDDTRGAARKVADKMALPAEEGYGPWELAEDSIAFGNALAQARSFAETTGRVKAQDAGELVEIGLSAPVIVGDKTFTPNENGVVTISKADLKALYNSPDSTGVQITLDPSYVTDETVFNKFGFKTMAEFEALAPETKLRLQGLEPRYKVDKIKTAEGTKLVRTNIDTGEQLDLKTYDPVAAGDWFVLTYKGDDGTDISTVQDISTADGKAVLKIVNEQTAKEKGSASMRRVGTENLNPQAYLTNTGSVVTSFDNRTFIDPVTRKVRLLTEVNANTLGQADVSKMLKKDQLAIYADNMLRDILGLDESYNLGEADPIYETQDADGNVTPLSADEQRKLRAFIKAETDKLSGVKTTTEDIKKGVGLASNVFAALNNVGGTLAPETFNEIFGENAEARNAVERFGILALSSLSPNPGLRLSNQQIELVQRILPKSGSIFTNIESEAKNFQTLVEMMQTQRIKLLEAIRLKDPLVYGTESNMRGTLGKLKELNMALSLVRIDTGESPLTLDNALGATDSVMEGTK